MPKFLLIQGGMSTKMQKLLKAAEPKFKRGDLVKVGTGNLEAIISRVNKDTIQGVFKYDLVLLIHSGPRKTSNHSELMLTLKNKNFMHDLIESLE